jgi:hypothetical protein
MLKQRSTYNVEEGLKYLTVTDCSDPTGQINT